jgi:hypothetical protein
MIFEKDIGHRAQPPAAADYGFTRLEQVYPPHAATSPGQTAPATT